MSSRFPRLLLGKGTPVGGMSALRTKGSAVFAEEAASGEELSPDTRVGRVDLCRIVAGIQIISVHKYPLLINCMKSFGN